MLTSAALPWDGARWCSIPSCVSLVKGNHFHWWLVWRKKSKNPSPRKLWEIAPAYAPKYNNPLKEFSVALKVLQLQGFFQTGSLQKMLYHRVHWWDLCCLWYKWICWEVRSLIRNSCTDTAGHRWAETLVELWQMARDPDQCKVIHFGKSHSGRTYTVDKWQGSQERWCTKRSRGASPQLAKSGETNASSGEKGMTMLCLPS